MKFKFWMALSLFFVVLTVKAQKNQEPNPFDFGKMWTFENPPKDWFAKAYNFKPEDKWWDDVRKSSLRFATWCSASFISPDGLIMTNHHCSRDVVVDLQKEGVNFDKQGFYGTSMADEICNRSGSDVGRSTRHLIRLSMAFSVLRVSPATLVACSGRKLLTSSNMATLSTNTVSAPLACSLR